MRSAAAWLVALSMLAGASALAQVAPGDLLVSEYAAGSVANVKDGGDFTGQPRFATGLSGPLGMCIGPGGDLYVAEFDSGEITIIT